MALENLTPVSETIQGWQLLSAQDMHDALEYLTAKNYTGTVSAVIDGTGAILWQLIVSSAVRQATQAIGVVNDWVIIENDTIASICPAEHFNARYQIVP